MNAQKLTDIHLKDYLVRDEETFNMLKMRTILVDDERLALVGLTKLIERNCPSIEIIGTASTFVDALKLINEKEPDLVFLDIEMPHANGFELLEALSFTNFKLIFTTAYADYAIKAIKAKADDYLLKPIDSDELMAAVEKLNPKDDSKEIIEKEEDKLVINTQDNVYYISFNDILYLKSDGNYTIIQIENGKSITVSQTLKRLEEKLNEQQFARVHHSYVVNKNKIFEFNKTNLKITLSDGYQIPVSIRKKKSIMK